MPFVRAVLLCIPMLANGQISPEDLGPTALEILDTSTLNTITPRLLWQVFGVSKDEVYSFFKYKETFGKIEHLSELYFIDGLDSSTADYLKAQFTLEKNIEPKALRLIGKSSLSKNQTRFSQRVIFQESHLKGALHLHQDNGTTSYGGFIQTQVQQTLLILGNFTLHAGQGLLFGTPVFPSLTTSEYFRLGPMGHAGSSIRGLKKGLCIQQNFDRHALVIAQDSNRTLLSIHRELDLGSIGACTDGRDGSIYAKVYRGNLRAFAECGSKGSKLGVNTVFKDVLFESNCTMIPKGRAQFTHHMSFRNGHGFWKFMWSDAGLRLDLVHQHYTLCVREHRSIERSWRIRLKVPTSIFCYEAYLHQESIGLVVAGQGNFSGYKYQIAFAAAKYKGMPIWLAAPTARGFIGSVPIYDDFFGLLAKFKFGPFYLSSQINIVHPASSKLMMSIYRSL